MPDDKPKQHGLKLSMITQPQARSSGYGEEEAGERDLRSGRPDDHMGSEEVTSRPPYGDAPPGAGTTSAYREEVQAQGIGGFRVLARIVDYIIIWAASYAVILPVQMVMFTRSLANFQPVTGPDGTARLPDNFWAIMLLLWGVMAATYFTVSVLYFFVLEHKYKKTGGKKAFGLLVLDNSGKRATAKQLLSRAAIYTFGMVTYLWIAELIVMLVRADGRSLTDMICGTRVIRVKQLYYSA